MSCDGRSDNSPDKRHRFRCNARGNRCPMRSHGLARDGSDRQSFGDFMQRDAKQERKPEKLGALLRDGQAPTIQKTMHADSDEERRSESLQAVAVAVVL